MWLFKRVAKKAEEINTHPARFSRKKQRRTRRNFSPEQKLAVLKEFGKSKLSMLKFSAQYGISNDTLSSWQERYKAFGEAGLTSLRGGKQRVPVAEAVKEEIFRLKKEHPEMGAKKISDWLARNKFIRISTSKIVLLLKENPETALLIASGPNRHARKHPEPLRFERSRARQMYQMDIMTWMLKGLYRVYVITCLDDYSRFVVSFGIFRRARCSETMDVLKAAIEQYGMPEEVLTDNGPQFYTWRGRSEFQKFLVRSGIQGVRSRPRHPQTLGKVESFWRNMYQEMLSRTPIASFEEAQDKIKEWVQYYNYKRPHQGIDGLVPADRFFGVEKPVREAMEHGAAMVKDALVMDPKRLKEPMYLVGRVGGKEITLIAKEGSIIVSGLDEVEKKDSPDAVTGVKLESEPPTSLPEVMNDGGNPATTGTVEVQPADTGRNEGCSDPGGLAGQENSGPDLPGAVREQGSILPVGTESPVPDDPNAKSGEPGTTPEEPRGGTAATQ
jgi:transposase InsO family protein